MVRWPALINVRDKNPVANLSQMPNRGGGGWKQPKRKHTTKGQNKNWHKTGKLSAKKARDRELKTTGPSPGDKPSKTVNGEPIFVKELFGKPHKWCAKCGRWTTSHNTNSHIGKNNNAKKKPEMNCENGVCTSVPVTSSTHFANQASSYLIPADPRIHLAMLHPCNPADPICCQKCMARRFEAHLDEQATADTEDTTTETDINSGGDGNSTSKGDDTTSGGDSDSIATVIKLL